ncbi:MAG: SprT-like domain-containing protein [Bacteroidetes bacterium]|nr:SprT-like domain-containing protein [Bacteroidota bacterium]MBS1650202.1 SprT-like domain-containing protein [Bacteroidota bacterium]
MAIVEHPMQALANYLPYQTFELVVQYLNYYKVHLTVTQKRKSVLGNYRNAHAGQNHRITINGNLNKYEFLITLLHELAHLLVFEQYGHKVEVHGKEWKGCYSKLLIDFVQRKIFPADIETALQKSIINPAATANGETELLLVLRKYNYNSKADYYTISELPVGTIFQLEDGRTFKKGEKRRKRFEAVEIKTNRKYSFSAVSEVKIIKE